MTEGSLHRALVDLTGIGWRLARSRLDELTNEEFFWEPVQGCWSLRPKTELDPPPSDSVLGDWWVDGDEQPPPDPPPFTTVAWLVAHMILGTWNWNDIIAGREVAPEPALASTASAAVEQWNDVITHFEEMVAGFSDAELTSKVSAWGGQVTRSFLVAHVVTEVLHHSAEVGRIRDLYRNRRSWSST
jgi:hypothetical protein